MNVYPRGHTPVYVPWPLLIKTYRTDRSISTEIEPCKKSGSRLGSVGKHKIFRVWARYHLLSLLS